MRKIIALALSLVLLSACSGYTDSQVSEQGTVNTQAYENADLGISFNYLDDWEISLNEEQNVVSVLAPVMNGDPDRVWIKFPSQSFEEYEAEFQDLIANNLMSVSESVFIVNDVEHPLKRYRQETWTYELIDFSGTQVAIGYEAYWSEYETQGLRVIMESLSIN